MTKKYDWIDCLKGFGAVLVIFGHLNPFFPIERYIYSFHMPLFFFISGLLKKKNNNDSFRSFIGKKAKTLLIPLAVWDLISALALFILGFDKKELLNGALFINETLPMNTPIWFLLTLFLCEVLYQILYSLKVPDIVIACTTAVIGPLLCEQTSLPFTLYLVPITMFFYVFGIILSPVLLKDKLHKADFCSLPVLLILSIIFGAILNDRISMANGYYNNVVFFMIGAVSGVLLWVQIFRILPVNRLLKKVSEQTMFLMCWQYMLFFLGSMVSKKMFSYDIWYHESTLKALIVTTAVIVITFAVIWVIDRIRRIIPPITQLASYFGIRLKPSENNKYCK